MITPSLSSSRDKYQISRVFSMILVSSIQYLPKPPLRPHYICLANIVLTVLPVPISAQANPPEFFQKPHCWVYCIFRSIRKSIFLVSFADLSRSLFFRNHAARNLSKVLFCTIRAVLADKKSPPDPYLSKEEKFYFQKLSSLDTICRPIIYWFP